ncbi:hypothetical protein RKD28_000025 [Streptomyces sp. SAI-229]
MARPADEADISVPLGRDAHLPRPDPAHLAPWCLAGFVGASAPTRFSSSRRASRRAGTAGVP